MSPKWLKWYTDANIQYVKQTIQLAYGSYIKLRSSGEVDWREALTWIGVEQSLVSRVRVVPARSQSKGHLVLYPIELQAQWKRLFFQSYIEIFWCFLFIANPRQALQLFWVKRFPNEFPQWTKCGVTQC